MHDLCQKGIRDYLLLEEDTFTNHIVESKLTPAYDHAGKYRKLTEVPTEESVVNTCHDTRSQHKELGSNIFAAFLTTASSLLPNPEELDGSADELEKKE